MKNMVIANSKISNLKQLMRSVQNFQNRAVMRLIVAFTLFTILCNLQVIAQVTSEPFTTTIEADEIEAYGDYTVEEALARIPGIQVDRDGNINLRGVGQKNYYVTVNGQRLGTTGLGERSFDLSIISADLVKKIEFTKVATPDMDGDGLGGVINIITEQPDSTQTLVTGGIGGGFTTRTFENQVGPTGRAWVGYNASLSDDFTITMKVNYQRDDKGWQSLGMNYGVQDFGSGNVDVLERFSPGLQTEMSNRIGGVVNLDYVPNEISNFYIRGMVNADFNREEDHYAEWLANESWDDQNLTGSGASYGRNLHTRDTDFTIYTFNAGAKHEFDAFTLMYDAGWSQSRVFKDEYLFPFSDSGVEYNVNFDDRNRPVMSPVDEKPAEEDLRLNEMTYIINNQVDRRITGNIDVEVPISLGLIKVGGSAMHTAKDANDIGAYGEYHHTFGLSRLTLNDFEKYDLDPVDVFEENYDLGRLLNQNDAKNFYQSSIPNMRLDEAVFYKDTHIRNFYGEEQIYAGYGMLNLELDQLTVLLGARAEFSNMDYDGRTVEYNRFGRFDSLKYNTTTNSYLNLLPNARVSYQLSEQSSVHLAYSRTIRRPDFQMLNPFVLALPEDTLLYSGNTDLEPMVSDNFDLAWNYSLPEDGMVSINAFYKNVADYIQLVNDETQIQLGEYSNYDALFEDGETTMTVYRQQFQNTENTATIYGVEVSADKKLSFLPGVLSNLSANANYTWSQAEFDGDRNETTDLVGHSPHVVNAALAYHQNKFSAQVAYHWTAEMLTHPQESTQLAPSIGNNPIYLDRYQDGYSDLSATVSYQVTENTELWANIYNLLNTEQIEYAENRDYYPTSIYKRVGIEFNAGVRLTF